MIIYVDSIKMCLLNENAVKICLNFIKAMQNIVGIMRKKMSYQCIMSIILSDMPFNCWNSNIILKGNAVPYTLKYNKLAYDRPVYITVETIVVRWKYLPLTIEKIPMIRPAWNKVWSINLIVSVALKPCSIFRNIGPSISMQLQKIATSKKRAMCSKVCFEGLSVSFIV